MFDIDLYNITNLLKIDKSEDEKKKPTGHFGLYRPAENLR